MAIADDFTVSTTGDIRYVGAAHAASGAGYYTVLELHRWLQDLADDGSVSVSGDNISIVSSTPSDRSTDNIITLQNSFNIDQTASEHLYDGSILQASGDEIWDGVSVIASAGMDMQIIQDGAMLDDSLANDDFWNSIPFGTSDKGLNPDSANGISHRFVIKVRTGGADIDGRRFICTTRVPGQSYSEFKINGSNRGVNVVALTYANDLNDSAGASGYTTITNTEGYRLLDVNNDGSDEAYYSEWNRDVYTINQLYERLKYLSRGEAANAATLYGIDARLFRGITHELDISSGAGTWVEPESVSWTGGTGQLLAVDNTTSSSATKLWMQILTGTAPSSGTITGNGGATATVTGNTERTVSTPFVGLSTGTAIIGAFGLGIEVTDLANTDKVFDLTNTERQPPLNVTFTITNLTSGEDRVLVGPDAGSTALDTGQFLLSTATTANTGTSIVLKAGTETPGTGTNSATDTPSTGTIRLLDNSGVYQRIPYTARTIQASTMTFTVVNTDVPTASVNNNAFISYVDAAYNGTSATDRFTSVYSADRALFIRVRDGGGTPIKTFETGGTLGNADASVAAIRTSDA
jgi:hypothetical protein